MKSYVNYEKVITATYVCARCGDLYGAGKNGLKVEHLNITWHNGMCDICDKFTEITDFREFGYAHKRFLRKDLWE